MNSKLILCIALLLPCIAMADENYQLQSCAMDTDLRVSNDISDTSTRVKSSIFKDQNGNVIVDTYSKKGATIIIRVPEDTTAVTVAEVERKARVSDEYERIIHSTSLLTGSQSLAKATQSTDSFRCVRIIQEYDKSKITVTVATSDSTTKQDKTIEKTYLAGPIEHWYFSVDVPVTSTRQLTYDAKSGTYAEKNAPSSFYASINYKFGDVLENEKDFTMSLNNLSFKPLMVKVNGPTESYGMGVSYDIGSAVIFAARVRTKNDPSASDAATNGVYSTIYGLSFDIDRGFSWLSNK